MYPNSDQRSRLANPSVNVYVPISVRVDGSDFGVAGIPPLHPDSDRSIASQSANPTVNIQVSIHVQIGGLGIGVAGTESQPGASATGPFRFGAAGHRAIDGANAGSSPNEVKARKKCIVIDGGFVKAKKKYIDADGSDIEPDTDDDRKLPPSKAGDVEVVLRDALDRNKSLEEDIKELEDRLDQAKSVLDQKQRQLIAANRKNEVLEIKLKKARSVIYRAAATVRGLRR